MPIRRIPPPSGPSWPALGAQAVLTVNYGSGTPQEAAAWVRFCNVDNQYGIKYWEIGNETYGFWEKDNNDRPHDPYTYAQRAKDYIQQMKAVDPTIKIGVPAETGEDSWSNYQDHPALNPMTGQTHNGWMPVLLATLKSLGVTPDFLDYHRYPEDTEPGQPSPDDDATLLQSATGWTNDAADLRVQITAYFGAGGENIELLCMENNSDLGLQGKQSTSLINGLYYADSLGQLMLTEFNGFLWWDFRNGTENDGSFAPTLYGWRDYGDFGMVNGLDTRHPTFYAAKLMHDFVSPGDSILGVSSDNALLSAYAAQSADGTLSLLVINKDLHNNSLSAQIAFNGFTPDPGATIQSYGIAQDNAARDNGPAQAQDIATADFNGAAATFSFDFPLLSMTLMTLLPAVAP
jgi:alpha-L-arabinofuranosidase